MGAESVDSDPIDAPMTGGALDCAGEHSERVNAGSESRDAVAWVGAPAPSLIGLIGRAASGWMCRSCGDGERRRAGVDQPAAAQRKRLRFGPTHGGARWRAPQRATVRGWRTSCTLAAHLHAELEYLLLLLVTSGLELNNTPPRQATLLELRPSA